MSAQSEPFSALPPNPFADRVDHAVEREPKLVRTAVRQLKKEEELKPLQAELLVLQRYLEENNKRIRLSQVSQRVRFKQLSAGTMSRMESHTLSPTSWPQSALELISQGQSLLKIP